MACWEEDLGPMPDDGEDWAWYALADDEQLNRWCDHRTVHQYDGHHAREACEKGIVL
jgi:hypothetical protein